MYEWARHTNPWTKSHLIVGLWLPKYNINNTSFVGLEDYIQALWVIPRSLYFTFYFSSTGGVPVPDLWSSVWCWCLAGIHTVTCDPRPLLQEIFGCGKWLCDSRKLCFHNYHAICPVFPPQDSRTGGHHAVHVCSDSCYHGLCFAVQTFTRSQHSTITKTLT